MTRWLASAFFLADTGAPHTVRALVVAVALGALFGIVLIGLPGALCMAVVEFGLRKFGVTPPESSESTWAVAIVLSMGLPLCLPLAHLASSYGLPRNPWVLGAVALGWVGLITVPSVLVPTR